MRTGGDDAAIRFDVLVAARHENLTPDCFAVTNPADQNAVGVEQFMHYCHPCVARNEDRRHRKQAHRVDLFNAVDQANRAPHLALVIANGDCLFRPADDRSETGG